MMTNDSSAARHNLRRGRDNDAALGCWSATWTYLSATGVCFVSQLAADANSRQPEPSEAAVSLSHPSKKAVRPAASC